MKNKLFYLMLAAIVCYNFSFGWNTPNISSPTHNSTVNSGTAVLDWDYVPNSIGYEVVVDTSPSFNSPAKRKQITSYLGSSSSLNDTRFIFKEGYYGVKHYWKVRAYKTGDTSSWTTNYAYTLTSNGPTLVFPANGATEVTGGTKLDWNYQNNVSGYLYEVDTTPLFNSSYKISGATTYISASNNYSDTYYILSDVFYGKKHYWRVKTYNLVDSSDWTPAYNFTVTKYGPTLLTPASGTSNVKGGVYLDWDSHNYVNGYDYEIDTTPLFNSPIKTFGSSTYINTVNNNSDTYFIFKNSYYGKKHYWRVRSYNSIDTSQWTPTWNFTVSAYGPNLLLPASGTINTQGGVYLDWDSHNYVTGYHWEVDTTAMFNSSIKSSGATTYLTTNNSNTDTEFKFGKVFYGKKHYWRVRSYNAVDTSLWTNAWNFTVTQVGPSLVSPANGLTSVDPTKNLKLDWDSHDYIAFYEVQLDSNNQFNTPYFQSYITSYVNTAQSNTDTQRMISNLEANKIYYWRVRSISSVDTSDWTSVWAFSTGSTPIVTPTAPTLMSPANGEIISSSFTTTDWLAVSKVSFYDYELDTTAKFNSPALIQITSNYISTSSSNNDTKHDINNLEPGVRYFWRVRTRTSSATSEWSDTWNFMYDISSAVNEEKNDFISVYPNPFNNEIWINNGQNQSLSVMIIDQLGRKVFETQLNSSSMLIDLSNLENGLYFIVTQDENNKLSTQRIIKK